MNYLDILRKMRNFHMLVITLAIIFLIEDSITLSDVIAHAYDPPNYPTGEEFNFYGTYIFAILYLGVWILFSWWSWIPLAKIWMEPEMNSQMSTHISRADSQHLHTSQSHEDENPIPTLPNHKNWDQSQHHHHQKNNLSPSTSSIEMTRRNFDEEMNNEMSTHTTSGHELAIFNPYLTTPTTVPATPELCSLTNQSTPELFPSQIDTSIDGNANVRTLSDLSND